jgi:cytohesin
MRAAPGRIRFVVLLLVALCAAPALAHETDQHSLPLGRRFVDLGDHLNRWAYSTIREGVRRTNRRIHQARQNEAPEARLKELQSPETVTRNVANAFPSAYRVIEDLNWLTHRGTPDPQHPGRLLGYKEQFDNIYKNVHFPLDPRQFFRIWHAATIKAYGTYLGTDKIGHFTDMGKHYYNAYRRARNDGQSKADARAAAVEVGTDGLVFGEEGALGYLSAGAFSNADLAANYLGLLFYRNLTASVVLKNEERRPMLQRRGAYWRLAPHVRPDGDFFRRFISDHLNEALNPSLFESGMRASIRRAVRERTDRILWRYRDRHGDRRRPGWFARKTASLADYHGRDYGHRGDRDELITLDQVCYPAFPKDSEPGQRNRLGYTPLHTAVLHGRLEAVASLLERGADPDARVEPTHPAQADGGATPLHLAARDGREKILQLLLDHGAAPTATDHRGTTPLHRAVAHPTVAQVLLTAGADPTAADRRGRTPLHWAAVEPDAPINQLLEAGAAPEIRDRQGRTPLHRAADAGRFDAARALLDAGADPGRWARLGVTPLHAAAANDHPRMVRLLVRRGAAVNAPDRPGWSPVHEAARRGHVAALRALLLAGADPEATDALGTTPLHLAARHRRTTTALYLMQAGARADARTAFDATPLHEATFAGDSTLAAALIELGAEPDHPDQEGRTPRDLARERADRRLQRTLARNPAP